MTSFSGVPLHEYVVVKSLIGKGNARNIITQMIFMSCSTWTERILVIYDMFPLRWFAGPIKVTILFPRKHNTELAGSVSMTVA